MVQHGSKFGPSWGHVGFQNRPGRVHGRKNASQRPLEKRIRKSIEKPRSGEAPGREEPGGGYGKSVAFGVPGGTCRGGNNLESRHLAPLQQDLKTRNLKTRSLQASKETPSHQLKLLLNRRLDLEASLAQ